MQYDFDTVTERRGTNSLKWDVAERELPMWVADMDFPTAPQIRQAVERRAGHGVFGYSVAPDAWYEAIIGWWRERHHLQIEKEWLMFVTGVVPAISSAVRKFTTAGENVLVMTPVYNIFFNSIRNNGRNVLESRLLYDGERYQMDFEDLERKLSDPQTSMMLLCNPQNPTGRIWNREELARLGELCGRYHVLVLSDEIHCDLTDPGREYVPFASVSEINRQISITCLAPTKTFNLAGLQTAAIMAPDGTIRHRMNRAINTDEVAEPNAFAIDAAVAAFKEGGPWLDALREYVYENKQMVKAFVAERIGELAVVPSEATYLLWLDCRKLSGGSGELARFIREDSGLYLCDGEEYGNGDGFLRMNIACPRARLEDGLRRLEQSVKRFADRGVQQLDAKQPDGRPAGPYAQGTAKKSGDQAVKSC